MASIPLKKVVLYKHGVGFFERQGKIEGNASIELMFKEGEMNDVLKSLTILDKNGGVISSISYEGDKPVKKQLEEVPFPLPRGNVYSGIFKELKGARVELQAGEEKVEGKVIGIETRKRTAYETVIEEVYLVLLNDRGEIQNFDLMQIRNIRFQEERIQKDLNHLLDILISTKKKDLKRLTVYAQGEGEREIYMSYIVETPVWKTSYRILLPAEKEDSPLIQGWAMIDNTQEEDWEQVQLSLIAGLPISFIMELYKARYQKRPKVEIQEKPAYAAPDIEESFGEISPEEDSGLYDCLNDEILACRAPAPSSFSRSLRSAQKVTKKKLETGDFYCYEIQNPVTVKRGESALVPIISGSLEGKKVAIFNQSIREKNPLSAVLLKNTLGITLEGGPVTMYERDTYVGEALLKTFRPNEEQILAYAVDLGCYIEEVLQKKYEEFLSLTFRDGSFFLKKYVYCLTPYKIHNKNPYEIDLFLDHPKKNSRFKLVSPQEPYEETENYYRFRFLVPAKNSMEFKVKERYLKEDYFGLQDISMNQVHFLYEKGVVNEQTKEEILELIRLQSLIAEKEKDIETLQKKEKALTQNQDRICHNLNALRDTLSEKSLREAYLKQLKEDEETLKKTREEREKREKEKEELKKEWEQKLREFSLKMGKSED
ncbi:MAG: hypothetical protein D6785_14665 [Planctomycetota bacterium]|nr:MAG: hypothetical protein D6785_14665 [Planctomycetota bacterium]